MKLLKLALSILVFSAICYLGYQIVTTSQGNQKHKQDYAELNHFKYGLFSVDAWKEQLTGIIIDEIEGLSLTSKNKVDLRQQLERQLGVFIDKVYQRIEKANEDSPMKQTLIDQFLDIPEIKKGIPEYAEAILSEMSASKTEGQIKGMLKTKIDAYLKTTFDTQDKSLKDEIIRLSGSKDAAEAKQKLQKSIDDNNDLVSQYALILIGLATLLFIFEAFTKGSLKPVHYLILTLTLVVMMIVGVTTPMIDMEAKISKLSFVLMDHTIIFEDQILYFQSKSILDVFWVMIKHEQVQMKVVGLLVVGFSIVFPILKMLSSLAYYYDYCRARKYKIIKFFVLKSGKWSMADVLVVAIFMAYIGFNGIINSNLASMAESGENLQMVTTNGTNLQPGYFMFLAYTILAMFLSGFIRNRPYVCETGPVE